MDPEHKLAGEYKVNHGTIIRMPAVAFLGVKIVISTAVRKIITVTY